MMDPVWLTNGHSLEEWLKASGLIPSEAAGPNGFLPYEETGEQWERESTTSMLPVAVCLVLAAFLSLLGVWRCARGSIKGFYKGQLEFLVENGYMSDEIERIHREEGVPTGLLCEEKGAEGDDESSQADDASAEESTVPHQDLPEEGLQQPLPGSREHLTSSALHQLKSQTRTYGHRERNAYTERWPGGQGESSVATGVVFGVGGMPPSSRAIAGATETESQSLSPKGNWPRSSVAANSRLDNPSAPIAKELGGDSATGHEHLTAEPPESIRVNGESLASANNEGRPLIKTKEDEKIPAQAVHQRHQQVSMKGMQCGDGRSHDSDQRCQSLVADAQPSEVVQSRSFSRRFPDDHISFKRPGLQCDERGSRIVSGVRFPSHAVAQEGLPIRPDEVHAIIGTTTASDRLSGMECSAISAHRSSTQEKARYPEAFDVEAVQPRSSASESATHNIPTARFGGSTGRLRQALAVTVPPGIAGSGHLNRNSVPCIASNCSAAAVTRSLTALDRPSATVDVSDSATLALSSGLTDVASIPKVHAEAGVLSSTSSARKGPDNESGQGAAEKQSHNNPVPSTADSHVAPAFVEKAVPE